MKKRVLAILSIIYSFLFFVVGLFMVFPYMVAEHFDKGSGIKTVLVLWAIP